jgi:septum formation protein
MTSARPNDKERVPVVLASQSPRRRQLLTLIGIEHDVQAANIDETYLSGENPRRYAVRLAREKVEAVAKRDQLTIGSDTIVVVDGDVLGKPADAAEATQMLRRLSGRSHVVITGVAVGWRDQLVSDAEEVSVTFRDLTDDDIHAYIATGEPMDKAGAYGIQGFGATIVERVDGDYFAVMGLPLNRLTRLLESLGLVYAFGPVRLGRGAATA